MEDKLSYSSFILIDSLSSKFEVNFLLGLPKLSAVGYAQKACACPGFILLLPFCSLSQ